MAYTIHQISNGGEVGEMLSSGQTRNQVIQSLKALDFLQQGERLGKLPSFGHQLMVVYPLYRKSYAIRAC